MQQIHSNFDCLLLHVSFIRKSLVSLQKVSGNLQFSHTSQYLKIGGGGLVAKLCLTLAITWTVAHQSPLPMGFSRQEYWSGLPFPSPGFLKLNILILQAQ